MSDTEQPIALRVWRQLQKILEDETDPLLSIDKFYVQKDALSRLMDGDTASDTCFLSYELTAYSDDALSFVVLFFRDFFILRFGGMDQIHHYESFMFSQTKRYSTIGPELTPLVSAKRIARSLILTLKLFLNGQVACVLSYHNSHFLACEAYIIGYEPEPVAFLFGGRFPRFIKKSNRYRILQNRLIHEHYKVDENFPLLPPKIKGHRLALGRPIKTLDDAKPLTRAEFLQISSNINLQLNYGQPPAATDTDWLNLYLRSLSFWLSLLTTSTIALYVTGETNAEGLFRSLPFMLFCLLGVPLLSLFISSLFLNIRQTKLRFGFQTIGSRADQLFQKVGPARVVIIVYQLLLLGVSAFGRFWVLDPTSIQPLTGVEILSNTPWITLLFSTNALIILLTIISKKIRSSLLYWTISVSFIVYTVTVLFLGENHVNLHIPLLQRHSFFINSYILLCICSYFLGLALLIKLALNTKLAKKRKQKLKNKLPES